MPDKQPLRFTIKKAATAVAVFLLLVVGFCTFTDRPLEEQQGVNEAPDQVETQEAPAETREEATGDRVGDVEPDTTG